MRKHVALVRFNDRGVIVACISSLLDGASTAWIRIENRSVLYTECYHDVATIAQYGTGLKEKTKMPVIWTHTGI